MKIEYLSKIKMIGSTDPEQKRCWARELTQILEEAEPFIEMFCQKFDANFLSLDYKISTLEPKYVFQVGRTKLKYSYDDLKKELGIFSDN